jgi:hypothetical protein
MDTAKAVRPRAKVKREPGVTVTLYVPQSTADKLVTVANRENRPLSQMGKILIEEALKKRGV